MKVRHRLKATGLCPNNGLPDEYLVSVYCDRMIPCEEIVAAVDGLLAAPIYQEVFTQRLADRLGCRVGTRCRHLEGGRVLTECECWPQEAEAATG